VKLNSAKRLYKLGIYLFDQAMNQELLSLVKIAKESSGEMPGLELIEASTEIKTYLSNYVNNFDDPKVREFWLRDFLDLNIDFFIENTPIKRLGEGYVGEAFLLDNGMVLKIFHEKALNKFYKQEFDLLHEQKATQQTLMVYGFGEFTLPKTSRHYKVYNNGFLGWALVEYLPNPEKIENSPLIKDLADFVYFAFDREQLNNIDILNLKNIATQIYQEFQEHIDPEFEKISEFTLDKNSTWAIKYVMSLIYQIILKRRDTYGSKNMGYRNIEQPVFFDPYHPTSKSQGTDEERESDLDSYSSLMKLEKILSIKTAGSYQDIHYRFRQKEKIPEVVDAIKHYYGVTQETQSDRFISIYKSVEDVAEVAFRDKPAAILNAKIYDKYSDLFNVLIKKIIANPNYTMIISTGLSENSAYIIGKKQNVAAIQKEFEQAKRYNQHGRPATTRDFHYNLGKNLGYSDQDIDEFLAETHNTPDSASYSQEEADFWNNWNENNAEDILSPIRRNLDYKFENMSEDIVLTEDYAREHGLERYLPAPKIELGKYGKIFETGTKIREYVDRIFYHHSPQEDAKAKQSWVDDFLDQNSDILASYDPVKLLGSGVYGDAWLTDDGRVIKFIRDNKDLSFYAKQKEEIHDPKKGTKHHIMIYDYGTFDVPWAEYPYNTQPLQMMSWVVMEKLVPLRDLISTYDNQLRFLASHLKDSTESMDVIDQNKLLGSFKDSFTKFRMVVEERAQSLFAVSKFKNQNTAISKIGNIVYQELLNSPIYIQNIKPVFDQVTKKVDLPSNWLYNMTQSLVFQVYNQNTDTHSGNVGFRGQQLVYFDPSNMKPAGSITKEPKYTSSQKSPETNIEWLTPEENTNIIEPDEPDESLNEESRADFSNETFDYEYR